MESAVRFGSLWSVGNNDDGMRVVRSICPLRRASTPATASLKKIKLSLLRPGLPGTKYLSFATSSMRSSGL